MIIYKNKNFLEYMPDVRACDKGISELNDQWNNMELLLEINCPTQAGKILPNMRKVQKGFYALQQQLVETLIAETLNKMNRKIISKAQVVIDILIRNLYERTADVGFIATDDDIRQFVCQDEHETNREYMLNRLQEYVAKYSVYDEIILLNSEFQVLLNLNPENAIAGQTIQEPILENTVASTQNFMEHFCASPLQAAKERAHIFSSKIYNDFGEVAGIICLCFRFEDEVEKIFQKLSNEYDGSVIYIVDAEDTVIASSNANYVPLGISMETGEPGANNIVYYRGVEYIVQTVPTKGYQQYVGLGWKGCVMIPLALAFKEKQSKLVKSIASDTMAGLMSKADSFSAELKQIISQTQKIQHSLKQVVFNGQILATKSVSKEQEETNPMKPILHSIGKIGVNTSQLFEKSIQNLFATVITSGLQNVSFVASLCVDIMDRNLYERSDDCRWWALNPTFRDLMAQPELSAENKQELTRILEYVNSLYTVYRNLFLFDSMGKIIAVSNPERAGDIGRVLSAEYVRNILGNHNPEKYFVSAYDATELYDNRHTYIYGASITDSSNPQRTVGGIGIVFDSEFQFQSMLYDAIDNDEGAFAVFTDRNQKIIASTNSRLQTGEVFSLPSHLFATANGDSCSEILQYEGAHYAVGCACSAYYREYKCQNDGYQNDVLAFVFDKLSDMDGGNEEAGRAVGIDQTDITLSDREAHVKLATFLLNQQVFAMEQVAVLESMDSEKVIPLPGALEVVNGAVAYNKKYLAVVDGRKLLGMPANAEIASQLLIIQIADGTQVALAVDELNSILEVNASEIKSIAQIGNSSAIIKEIIYIENEVNKAVLMFNQNVLLQKLNATVAKDELQEALRVIEKNDDAADDK